MWAGHRLSPRFGVWKWPVMVRAKQGAGGKGGGEGGGAGILGLARHRLRGRNCLHCADSPADVSALPRNLFPRDFNGWVTFHWVSATDNNFTTGPPGFVALLARSAVLGWQKLINPHTCGTTLVGFSLGKGCLQCVIVAFPRVLCGNEEAQ